MRESILRASLPHIRAQSFTRQAIRAGLADLPSSSSPASSSLLTENPDHDLQNIFGEEGEAEKELVRLWEEEGIKNMSMEGQGETSGSGSGLREVLSRRLKYSEETAGEHIVQAHAIMQSPSSISPSSFNFPTPIARIIDHLQSRLTKELRDFELYRPPAAPLSTAGTVASSSLSSLSSLSAGPPGSTMKSMVAESASNAASKASSIATSAAAGLSAVSSKLSSSASSPFSSPSPSNSNSTSTSTSTSTGDSPLPSAHHLPLPLPPNPIRSFLYAWKIADEALHLSQPASYRALNDNHNTRSTSPTQEAERGRSQATIQGQGRGQSRATGREGGKDEVLRMGEGQGWEWYVRRGVLAGIYLRAESILMQPRALLAPNDQSLARATARLDELLENNYELAVRRLTLRGPMFGSPNDTSELAARRHGEEGRVLRDLAGFGMFVYKSWGGLFRSRGWIK